MAGPILITPEENAECLFAYEYECFDSETPGVPVCESDYQIGDECPTAIFIDGDTATAARETISYTDTSFAPSLRLAIYGLTPAETMAESDLAFLFNPENDNRWGDWHIAEGVQNELATLETMKASSDPDFQDRAAYDVQVLAQAIADGNHYLPHEAQEQVRIMLSQYGTDNEVTILENALQTTLASSNIKCRTSCDSIREDELIDYPLFALGAIGTPAAQTVLSKTLTDAIDKVYAGGEDVEAFHSVAAACLGALGHIDQRLTDESQYALLGVTDYIRATHGLHFKSSCGWDCEDLVVDPTRILRPYAFDVLLAANYEPRWRLETAAKEDPSSLIKIYYQARLDGDERRAKAAYVQIYYEDSWARPFPDTYSFPAVRYLPFY